VRQAVPQEIVALDGKALRRALNKDQSIQSRISHIRFTRQCY
jgi:hypothetical protein